jgi:hypothetical protein
MEIRINLSMMFSKLAYAVARPPDKDTSCIDFEALWYNIMNSPMPEDPKYLSTVFKPFKPTIDNPEPPFQEYNADKLKRLCNRSAHQLSFPHVYLSEMELNYFISNFLPASTGSQLWILQARRNRSLMKTNDPPSIQMPDSQTKAGQTPDSSKDKDAAEPVYEYFNPNVTPWKRSIVNHDSESIKPGMKVFVVGYDHGIHFVNLIWKDLPVTTSK